MKNALELIIYKILFAAKITFLIFINPAEYIHIWYAQILTLYETTIC